MAIDVRGLPVVLVHGSMHGAWCWDLLLPALAARGVQALTMDLPGHGRRTAEADVASLTTYAESVAAVLDKIDAERVVMVGHSMGGTTASLATALRPNRVSQIVYLSGQVLADGQAPLDTVPPERAVRLRAMALENGGTYSMSDDEIWSLWLSSLPRGDRRVQWALSQMTPQPLRPMVEPAPMAAFHALELPRAYIWPRDDRGNFGQRKDQSLRNLGRVDRYLEISGDHDAMISRPDEVAQALCAVIRPE